MSKLISITSKELAELREKQFKKQDGKCAILGVCIDKAECVLDHKHKLKSEECGGKDRLGCLRGVIHRNANSFEGKLERSWRRYGLHKVISLPELLRRCADYIEQPPIKELIIHPNERKIERKRITIPEYKRICKYYFLAFPKRKALPKYPRFGWNETWKKIYQKVYPFICRNKFSKEEKELIKKAQEAMKK